MSFSFAIIAIFLGVSTGIVASVVDNYGNKSHIIPIVLSGILLTFSALVCSFAFTSVKEMFAMVKYDHVKTVEVKRGNFRISNEDEKRIIFKEDTQNQWGEDVTYAILAWNDEENYRKIYENLEGN